MATMDDLERRIQTLEAQVAELVDKPSSKDIGTAQNPVKQVFLASRDNEAEARVLEIDPATGDPTTRKVGT